MSKQKEAEQAKEKLNCSTGFTPVEFADGGTTSGELVVQQLKENEASFAGELTDKLSHLTMPAALELADTVGATKSTAVKEPAAKDSGAAAAEDKKLAKVVGDPYTQEHQWVAACEEAGEKDLSGKASFLRIALYRSAATGGVFFSFASIMLCYVSSIFFAACTSNVFGISADMFVNNLVGLDYVGFLLAGAAALFFWSSFFSFFRKTIRYLAVALFVGVAFHSIEGHLFLGTIPSALLAAAYVPLLYLTGWVGSACREALPLHIGSKKLASALMPALALPGLAMVATFVAITNPAFHQSDNYAPATLEMTVFNATSIFLCTLVPGFMLARSTNSKTPVGSASLAVMLQTPLLVGLIVTFITCVSLGMAFQVGLPSNQAFYWLQGFSNGNWAQFGVSKAITVVFSMLLAVISAAAGGAAGAWCNKTWMDKTHEKPPELG